MNEAFESVTFWVYRDSMPIHRSSSDSIAYAKAREAVVNFPHSKVRVVRIKTTEQEMMKIEPKDLHNSRV